MTIDGPRGPLLALSFALATISAVAVLAYVWPSSFTFGFNGLVFLSMASAPVLWVVLTAGLLIRFRKRAIVALSGLPFVLPAIALNGFILLDLYGGPASSVEYRVLKEEFISK